MHPVPVIRLRELTFSLCRAFRTGDPQCVDDMYKLLWSHLDAIRIPRKLLKAQLEKDFGITMTDE